MPRPKDIKDFFNLSLDFGAVQNLTFLLAGLHEYLTKGQQTKAFSQSTNKKRFLGRSFLNQELIQPIFKMKNLILTQINEDGFLLEPPIKNLFLTGGHSKFIEWKEGESKYINSTPEFLSGIINISKLTRFGENILIKSIRKGHVIRLNEIRREYVNTEMTLLTAKEFFNKYGDVDFHTSEKFDKLFKLIIRFFNEHIK